MTTQIQDLDDEADDLETASPDLGKKDEAKDEIGDYVPPDQDEIEIAFAAEQEQAEQEEQPKREEREEEGEEDYSRKVRERITREVKQKHEARQRAEQAERRVKELEQELQGSRIEREKADIDGKIEQIVQKARDAEMNDDVGERAKLQAQLANLYRRKDELENAPPKREAPPRTEAEAPAGNPLFDQWRERNPWFDKPEYDAESAAAETISNRLLSEGYDPYDPEFFKKVDVELRKRVKVPESGPKPRQSVASVTREPSVSGKRVVVLDKSDIAMMKMLRIDINDKAAVQEYARNKKKG